MRTQEHLVERVKTIHQILFHNQVKSYEFMCVELLWAFFHDALPIKPGFPFKYIDHRSKTNRGGYLIDWDNTDADYPEALDTFMNKWWSQSSVYESDYFNGNKNMRFLSGPGTPQKEILFCLSELYADSKGLRTLGNNYEQYQYYMCQLEDLERFQTLYNAIK